MPPNKKNLQIIRKYNIIPSIKGVNLLLILPEISHVSILLTTVYKPHP